MLVGISDLRVNCIIGCLPEEEEAEQEILFDVEVELPRPKKDSIENTLNYLLLKECAENIAHKNTYRLIESLAYDVAEALLNQMEISSAKVTVKKPSAIPNGKYAYSTAYLERHAR